MKKAYVKPEIFFEDFSLSSSIAANCEYKVGSPTEGVCALVGSGNIRVFDIAADGTQCEYAPGLFDQPDDMWDGFCYHVPTSEANMFNS